MSLLTSLIDAVRFSLGATVPLGAPLKVQIEITHRCNSRCRSCHFWRSDAMPELTYEQWRKILLDLREIGVPRIAFGGGEPTLYPMICELIAFARELGMRVSLGTNGLLLDKLHAQIAASGLDIIEISLDGPAAVHDANRGIPGAFARTMDGVKALRQHHDRPLIQFNYTPNLTNVRQLAEFAEVAVEHGAELLSIEPAHLLNEQLHLDRELFVPKGLIDEFEQRMAEVIKTHGQLLSPPLEYYQRIGEFFRDPVKVDFCRQYRCISGYLLLVIDPGGNVFGCPAKEVCIGNAVKTPMREIWRSLAHREDNARVKRGAHKPCWLNSVAPVNMVADMVRKPWQWPRLLSIVMREVNRRI